MDLVVPRSRLHALSLIGTYGATNIVPGIYSTTIENDSTCTMFSASGSACVSNWNAIDGGDWFLNQFSTGEPNGDYNPFCYLGMTGANADGFIFNDGIIAMPTMENPQACFYGGTNYICSLNDKGN